VEHPRDPQVLQVGGDHPQDHALQVADRGHVGDQEQVECAVGEDLGGPQQHPTDSLAMDRIGVPRIVACFEALVVEHREQRKAQVGEQEEVRQPELDRDRLAFVRQIVQIDHQAEHEDRGQHREDWGCAGHLDPADTQHRQRRREEQDHHHPAPDTGSRGGRLR
jgi:hypothetical protein